MKPKIIKVGNFNAFNLVSPNVQYYRRKYTEKDYKKKIQWMGQQLDHMDADLVGFQEVFHAEALQDALHKSRKLNQAHKLVAAPTGDLPRVALATRFNIIRHDVIEEFPIQLDIEGVKIPIDSFSRPVLRAEIELPLGIRAIVFVVHLKSKRPDFYEGEGRDNPVHMARAQTRSLIRRAAEATALRTLLLEDLTAKSDPVILLGDVNDSGLAVTTRIISGEPPHRKYPMEVKREIWDRLLYHARDIQARMSYHDFYYTHIHNGHHEALDHIMFSQELVGENPNRIGRVGNVKVFNDHLEDETLSEDKIPVWNSDHGLVVAAIELDRRKKEPNSAKKE